MIVPSGQYLILEQYHNFKYVYWTGTSDTLTRLDNGVLQGKHGAIDPEIIWHKVDKCDTTVNKIRNSALDHRLFSKLDKISIKEIGYENQKFKSNLGNDRPTERQTVKLCHDEFRVLASAWFKAQADNIEQIKAGKIARLKVIKANSPEVDKEYIKSFLSDYGSCETDQIAVLELIINHPDDFLSICKEMDDFDFFSVTLNLSSLPDNSKANKAIEQLENSPIRTNRKKKLIKKMKRHIV